MAEQFIERFGNRTQLYTDLGGGIFIVEDEGASRVGIGEAIGLRFDPGAAHLFDDERGYHARGAAGQ